MTLHARLISHRVPDDIEWVLWHETVREAEVVEESEVGPFTVRTVRLVLLDNGRGAAQWYETMVFGNRDDFAPTLIRFPFTRQQVRFRTDLGYRQRYDTREEAADGHQQAVAWTHDQL